MKVLVTGANGFIGRNLCLHLREQKDIETLTFLRNGSSEELNNKVAEADFIFHLAGVNRPIYEAEFFEGNSQLTQRLCDAVKRCRRPVPIVYASSIQAELDNPYGRSKKEAEDALLALSAETNSNTYIYRLPNVFGKWCKPNYNSVVATFCHNISRGLQIQINDPKADIGLVYVDDVVSDFMKVLSQSLIGGYRYIEPLYHITVGDLAVQLQEFKHSRESLTVDSVGIGLTRALYSTFISYFTPDQFAYPLRKHQDSRGIFVEMLKTRESGQFSYFTAHPGVTRGGHYHHTKTEKFLVLSGQARFRFLNIDNGATHELCVDGNSPTVVETIPGWTHDITNIGTGEMVVMLWANEVFDTRHPDTVAYEIEI